MCSPVGCHGPVPPRGVCQSFCPQEVQTHPRRVGGGGSRLRVGPAVFGSIGRSCSRHSASEVWTHHSRSCRSIEGEWLLFLKPALLIQIFFVQKEEVELTQSAGSEVDLLLYAVFFVYFSI